MLVSDVMGAMERVAPLSAAEPWDRVGLQVGVASREVSGPVLLTIDLTERVLAEAVEIGAGVIVAYHCPIWEPLDRLTDARPTERIIRGAIEAGIAIYSPHTALDAADGGVTDWLCEGLSGGAEGRVAGDCRALTPHAERSGEQEVKLVTFVPEDALEQVRNALASAGAGQIGEYRVCSFVTKGTGTFLGGEGTSPAVGERGRLERVEEARLEMVCSRSALPLAIETLREFHPYEEPAFDVYALEPKPRRSVGAGRRLALDQPATLGELAERMKCHLDRARVRVALVGDDVPVSKIGVVPGAGASLVPLAIERGCEAFVTGEMKHHEVVAALHAGMSLLLAGHTNTERGYLPRLAGRLKNLLPEARVEISRADRDPLVVV